MCVFNSFSNSEEISVNSEIASSEELVPINSGPSNSPDESDLQLKTITMGEYRKLLQLMVDAEKYKGVVRKMEDDIKSKDSKIKNLQATIESKERFQLSLSQLTDVICFRFFIIIITFQSILTDFLRFPLIFL